MLTVRQSKIYGALVGAAVGDSMGTVSEGFSPEFLKKRYGGYITDLEQPTDDGMTINARAGMVSDDFSVAYYTAEVMLENKSRMNRDMAIKGVLRWWEHPEYTCYVGPSTRNGIMKLIDPSKAVSNNSPLKCINGLASNGSGMKSGIMGVFNPHDMDAAIEDTLTMCSITHNNPISLSAACAVSAATAKAFDEDAGYYELLEAGLYGAREGYNKTFGKMAHISGCNVEKKMHQAIELGLRYQNDFEKAMIEIADIVGCGLYAYEAIPGCFGMIAACKGDLMQTLHMGVNAGSDADSLACMVGYILGALHGEAPIPRKFFGIIDRENNFDLKKMALDIDAMIGGWADA